MGQTIIQVDAFSDRVFAGNPAAVCVLPGPADDRWMQDLARELNVSETAFLYREGTGYRLRWFTPAVEVDLCGHATLASAHVLWEEGLLLPDEPARFRTRGGMLTARRVGAWIEMDFPSQPIEPATPSPELTESLGVPILEAGSNAFDLLAEVESEQVLRNLEPDLRRLAQLPVRGVMVTAQAATPGFDFVSRFFAPQAGVAEDPVTGSAHCALGPFWGPRLGKTELIAFQASARGGVVRVRLAGPRVILAGQAVTVLRAELLGD